MPGDVIIVNGDGIDPDWTITLGGVLQSTVALNLPTQVNFTVGSGTPLGDQEMIIMNVDGDSATLGTTINVRDFLRIITVTDNGDTTFGVTGANFIDADTTVTLEVTNDPAAGSWPQTVTFVDVNNLTFTDITTTGNYDVIVENLDGTTFRELNAVVIP